MVPFLFICINIYFLLAINLYLLSSPDIRYNGQAFNSSLLTDMHSNLINVNIKHFLKGILYVESIKVWKYTLYSNWPYFYTLQLHVHHALVHCSYTGSYWNKGTAVQDELQDTISTVHNVHLQCTNTTR